MPQELRGRRTEAEFQGVGQSRTLQTQTGQFVSMAQQTMSEEGGVYTAAFSVTPPADIDGSSVPFDAHVHIRWNENGATIRRIFSLVNGVSITLPGRIVDIRVEDVTPGLLPLTDTPTPGAGSEYTVAVVVQRGSRPAEGRPPTLYGGIATLAPHGTETLGIPKNAGVISIEVSAIEAAAFPTVRPNVVISFQAGVGIFKQYDPTLESGFVSVPPGATQLVITNADGANSANVTVNWGIDG